MEGAERPETRPKANIPDRMVVKESGFISLSEDAGPTLRVTLIMDLCV
jgi:hypothetical protein